MKEIDKQFLYKKIREKNEIIEAMRQLSDKKDEYVNSLAEGIELREKLIETLSTELKELKASKNKTKGWRFWLW